MTRFVFSCVLRLFLGFIEALLRLLRLLMLLKSISDGSDGSYYGIITVSQKVSRFSK